MILIYVGIIILGIIILLMTWVFSGSQGQSYERVCPVCNRKLTREDRVFADQIQRTDEPSELKIKGCTYCYKNPSDSKNQISNEE